VKTIFHNAKIISEQTDPAVYVATAGRRGDKDFVMSRSELKIFAACPRKWIRGYKDKGSTSTEWGQVMDCLLLDGENFSKRVAVYPETYPAKDGEKPWSNNATFCREWKAERKGMPFLKAEDAKEAHIALAALRSDPDIAAIVDTAKRQVFVMGEYHDPATGLIIPLKALIDIVPTIEPFDRSLIDFKTADQAAPEPWSKAVYAFGYHVQAAMYLDMFNAATGEDREDFRHIIQENYSPYEVAKRFLSAEFLELGRNRYLAALARYCRCLQKNVWPGYDDNWPSEVGELCLQGFTVTEPPKWALASTENLDSAASEGERFMAGEVEPQPLKQTDAITV